MDRAEIWICCGQGWGSTFLLNVKGGAGARFGRDEPAKMGRELVKFFKWSDPFFGGVMLRCS